MRLLQEQGLLSPRMLTEERKGAVLLSLPIQATREVSGRINPTQNLWLTNSEHL